MGGCCQREQGETILSVKPADKERVSASPENEGKTRPETPSPVSAPPVVKKIHRKANVSNPSKVTFERSNTTATRRIAPKRSKTISTVTFKFPTKILDRPFEEIYEIVETAAQDSYGVISTIRHRKTLLQRFARIVVKSETVKGGQVNRLNDEIAILSRIDHPNVLKFAEVVEDQSCYILLFEPIIECTLIPHAKIAGKLPELQIATVAMQLIQALNSCHKKGIIHKNISLRNLLFLETNSKSVMVKVVGVGAGMKSPHEKDTGINGIVAYFAPEMFKGIFGETGDVWGCAVIIYYLASKILPFRAASKDELRYEMEHMVPTFPLSAWGGFSMNLHRLLLTMLEPSFERRATMSAVISHEWMKESFFANTSENVDFALNNLRMFRSGSRLKMTVLAFLSANALSSEEKFRLTRAYHAIDFTGDDVIRKDDLLLAYSTHFSAKEATVIVNRIMDAIDIDKSGFLTSSEFLLAALDNRSLLKRERLQVSFELLDKDNSGNILLEELMLAMNCSSDDDEWRKLLSQVDKDSDGQLTFSEFAEIMKVAIQ